MRTLRNPQFQFGFVVLALVLTWYVLFSFRPVVLGFKMAVTDYDLLNPADSKLVGLQHFETIFNKYKLFWVSVRNTITYAVMVNLGTVPIALVFAYCLAKVANGRSWYQWALFLPVVVSMAAVALLFRFLMDPGLGIFNHALKAAGLPPSRWLTGPRSAMYSIVIVALWKGLGGNIVILTAGLLNVPRELYDVAKVDGASSWKTFWYVTLPLLSHVLKLVMILVTIGSLQVYTSAMILTRGGPGRATYMISQFVVEEAFTHLRFGLASSSAFVLFLAILVITLMQLRLTRVGWEY